MRAIFSGLSMVFFLFAVVFWLGDDWKPFLDFLLQLFLFCLLGKIVLVPSLLLAAALDSWRILCFAIALMVSVFIRWMIALFLGIRVGEAFPIVECWYGIPYTLFCTFIVYLALSRTSFMKEFVSGARS